MAALLAASQNREGSQATLQVPARLLQSFEAQRVPQAQPHTLTRGSARTFGAGLALPAIKVVGSRAALHAVVQRGGGLAAGGARSDGDGEGQGGEVV